MLEATTTAELLRTASATINTAIYLHEQKLEALAYTIASMEAELAAAAPVEVLEDDDSSGQEGGGTGNA
jgi:hypothetical protein